MSLQNIKINTLSLPMNKLGVEFTKPPAECKSRREIDTNTRMVLPDGRRLKVTGRFWNSWCSLQGQGRSIFDLFSHGEVFDRINREREDTVRVAIEASDPMQDIGGTVLDGYLLSCTNPKKPLLPLVDAAALVNKYEGADVQYEEGVISATFDCPFQVPYNIAGEDYKTQFVLQMPIDGYGMPLSYLTLLRLICENGLIGMAKAFKTSFQLGRGENNIGQVLERAMTTFSAEEGFHSFKERMEAASKSWGSMDEGGRLIKTINKSMHDDHVPVPERIEIVEKFDEMCGNPLKYYGLTSRDELSARKAKTIPIKATVYQLMTFATEVTTHHLRSPKAKNTINAWVGTSISSEYDLENTVSEFPDWKDFFIGAK